MIVRMHRRLCAKRSTELEVGSVGDHFIDVHVGLRSRPRLPHQQWEMTVQFAVGDVLGNGRNHGCALAIERSKFLVDLGGRTFDHAKRAHDLDRHALRSNAEIVQRALSLSAPESVSRNLQWPESVALDAGLGGFVARFGHEIRPTPPNPVFSAQGYADWHEKQVS